MISFESDYIKGAHELILKRLLETNNEALSGYGEDKYCLSAKEKIKKAVGREDAEVFLLTGGTQTNQIVIDTVLAAYEGVVCANTGHINTHEAGAIEFTGHKVLTLPNAEGKVTAEAFKQLMEDFNSDDGREHTVFPGMLYISHPTEYGTLYTKAELTELSKLCKKYEIPLYIDGARLGYGIMSNGTDLSLKDIGELADIFYIGGTKVGALCGEAVVFTHKNAPKHFFTRIKQHGALLAKGRLLGVQFDTLFTDDLYFKISRSAVEMADKMRTVFKEKGYKFFIETVTNQIFIVLDNDKMNELSSNVLFSFWEKADSGHTVVRFASSWATTEEDVTKLAEYL